jgi:hypothetical protein
MTINFNGHYIMSNDDARQNITFNNIKYTHNFIAHWRILFSSYDAFATEIPRIFLHNPCALLMMMRQTIYRVYVRVYAFPIYMALIGFLLEF